MFRSLLASLSTFVLASNVWAVSANLNCKIQWAADQPPIELNSNDRCAETCKVSLAGPEGVSFAGETSSASRIKLTVSSLTKNESLIFVKDFDYTTLNGTCATGEIAKENASGHCTVCVKP